MSDALYPSHSADVEAWLDCGVHGRVELSRIRRRSVVARVPPTIPPCNAELVIIIDGEIVRSPVYLPSGFKTGRRIARALSSSFEDVPF